MCDFSGYIKTRLRLEIAIENMHKIYGFEEYLTDYYLQTYVNDGSPLPKNFGHDEFIDCPYWAYEGSLDCGRTSDLPDYDIDRLVCQYRTGFHEPYKYGETHMINGVKMRFVVELGLCSGFHVSPDTYSDKLIMPPQIEYSMPDHYLRVWEILDPDKSVNDLVKDPE